jgi:hypothetical protein
MKSSEEAACKTAPKSLGLAWKVSNVADLRFGCGSARMADNTSLDFLFYLVLQYFSRDILKSRPMGDHSVAVKVIKSGF